MRAALLLAVAATACTAANTTANARNVKITTIAHGGYAQESDRKAVLATNDADYRRQWASLIGEGDIPSVDFDDGVVVFLLAGMRNTGGWSVQPQSARIEDGTAIIDAKVQGPKPGGMVTQAITYPYAVIVIHDSDVKKVHWPE